MAQSKRPLSSDLQLEKFCLGPLLNPTYFMQVNGKGCPSVAPSSELVAFCEAAAVSL